MKCLFKDCEEEATVTLSFSTFKHKYCKEHKAKVLAGLKLRVSYLE